MKILYFDILMPHLLKDTQGTIGGAAVQWVAWFKGLKENGHEVGLLTWKGALDYINKDLNFDIIESYDPEKSISKHHLFTNKIYNIYKAIKTYKPDYLIQASAKIDTGILSLIAKLLGVPFIHRIAHDTHVDERIHTMVSKKGVIIFKFGLKFSDFILAQNSYQYEKLRMQYPRKKIFKLHNPFEIETVESEILPRSERSYIAWVGNFRYMKNMTALLKVAKELSKIKFKVAGMEYENVDSETKIAVIELKKLSNVEFVGYQKRSEIKFFFLHAIALLNTSHFEGFSNTFLEAWSCGVPVLSTKNVNPDNIITKYNLGKVVNEYSGLVKCIEEIIALDDRQYEALSQTCYNYVKEYHDPKKLAAQFVDYLKNN